MQPGLCVDPAQPINWAHPLARGLVSMWRHLPLGQWGRGTRLRDLSRAAGNDCTLSNSPTWKGPAGRAGGYGALSVGGTTASDPYYAVASAVNLPATNAAHTVSVWMNLVSTTGTQHRMVYGSSSGNGFQAGSDRAAGFGVFKASTGATIVVAGSRPSTGAWHHVVFTWASGPANTLYVDGASAGTSSTPGDGNATTDVSFGININHSFTENTAAGTLLDGAAIWSRTLSAFEVATLYAEEQAGVPELLRWVRPAKRWSFPVPASASGNRRRRVLMLTD
jgi:hypothetical protein